MLWRLETNKNLDDFKNNQLQHLRPGFAELINYRISKIPESSPITLNSILEGIVNPMIPDLTERKTRMSNPEAVLGTFALFITNAYSSEDKSKFSHIFHRKIYMNDHFYYLANPADNTNWCFLTYPPLQGIDTTSPLQLRVAKNNVDGTSNFSDWKEFTYFKSGEIIPIIVFMACLKPESFQNLFKKGMAFINSTSTHSIDPCDIEILVTVSVIDSSHHNVGRTGSTFCGQDGQSFLTNLVENLIVADGFRAGNKVVFEFNDIILNHMHVPYLLPSGMKLPEFFEDKLSGAAGFNNRSVNFGEYDRCVNGTETYNLFKYFIKNEKDEIPTVALCAVECRYWAKNLLVGDLEFIFNKARSNLANLALVFCESFEEAHDEDFYNFKILCTENKCNFLKLMKAETTEKGKKKFVLDSCFHDVSIDSDVQITCIVLELSVINS